MGMLGLREALQGMSKTKNEHSDELGGTWLTDHRRRGEEWCDWRREKRRKSVVGNVGIHLTELMTEIRKAILTGDIDRAISLTQTFYPTVLEKNEPIYFRLRARKFVEMMRMCADGTGPITKLVDTPDAEEMIIDTEPQEEDEQVDDEVHMTDVTPTHPSSKFVIDEEDSDDERVNTAKQQHREATLLAEALAYGQQLQEDYRDDPREDVKRVLGEAFSLLAYTDPRGSVVGHLLEESGRREVAEELNSAILGSKPLVSFAYLVSMGKSSVAPLEMVVRHATGLARELVDNGVMNASLINVKNDLVM
jgi:Ran-binding protein 9/10